MSNRTRPEPAAPAAMPYELAVALKQHERACALYIALTPLDQRAYRDWIAAAKRAETRVKRAKECIRLILRGQRLSLRG